MEATWFWGIKKTLKNLELLQVHFSFNDDSLHSKLLGGSYSPSNSTNLCAVCALWGRCHANGCKSITSTLPTTAL